MNDWILSQELTIRLGFFFGVLGLMMILEALFPKRRRHHKRLLRWYANLGIVFFNSAVARIIMPVLPIGLATLAVEKDWGLFNILDVPYWTAFLASVVLFDCIIYLQHVMAHSIPLFWRLHRMHHADLDFDVTTGSRFHPVEILLSMWIKLTAILAIGPPVLAVLVFEVILNAMAMFNHSNLRLPPGLDRLLRGVVVTPDFHRVHHSIDPSETNRNFGFNLSLWDRLFGTYKAQPQKGHDEMEIGIDQFRDEKELHLHRMLWQPFFPGGKGYGFSDDEKREDR